MNLKKTSLFIGLTTLLTALPLLGGCRFGNQIEEDVKGNPYSYFTANNTRVLLCVDELVQNASNDWEISEQCAEAFQPYQIDFWNKFITNPVMFLQPQVDSREAYLISNDETQVFPIYLDSPSSKSFAHWSGRDKAPFFHTNTCTVKTDSVGEGTLIEANPHTDGFGRNIKGSLELAVGTYLKIEGSSDATLASDCASTFQEIWNCYNSGTGCNAAEAQAVKRLLAAYIDRGLLSASSFPPTLAGLYYQFDYQ